MKKTILRKPILKFIQFENSLEFEIWQEENPENTITQIVPVLDRQKVRDQVNYESFSYGVMVFYY